MGVGRNDPVEVGIALHPEEIGRETVTYVSNIYKYYIAYKLVMRERESKEAANSKLATAKR